MTDGPHRIEPTPEIRELFDERRFWLQPPFEQLPPHPRVPHPPSGKEVRVINAGIDYRMGNRREIDSLDIKECFDANDYPIETIVSRDVEHLFVRQLKEPHDPPEETITRDPDSIFFFRTYDNITQQYSRFKNWMVIAGLPDGKHIAVGLSHGHTGEGGTWRIDSTYNWYDSNVFRIRRNYESLKIRWRVGQVFSGESEIYSRPPFTDVTPSRVFSRINDTRIYTSPNPGNRGGGDYIPVVSLAKPLTAKFRPIFG